MHFFFSWKKWNLLKYGPLFWLSCHQQTPLDQISQRYVERHRFITHVILRFLMEAMCGVRVTGMECTSPPARVAPAPGTVGRSRRRASLDLDWPGQQWERVDGWKRSEKGWNALLLGLRTTRTKKIKLKALWKKTSQDGKKIARLKNAYNERKGCFGKCPHGFNSWEIKCQIVNIVVHQSSADLGAVINFYHMYVSRKADQKELHVQRWPYG